MPSAAFTSLLMSTDLLTIDFGDEFPESAATPVQPVTLPEFAPNCHLGE
jgi:hypothetical protein